MDMGVYWALVAFFYPLMFAYFIGTAAALVANWWQDRKHAKRLEDATKHLAKE